MPPVWRCLHPAHLRCCQRHAGMLGMSLNSLHPQCTQHHRHACSLREGGHNDPFQGKPSFPRLASSPSEICDFCDLFLPGKSRVHALGRRVAVRHV